MYSTTVTRMVMVAARESWTLGNDAETHDDCEHVHDHRQRQTEFRGVGAGVDVQYILHVGHEFPVDLGQGSPVFLQVRLKFRLFKLSASLITLYWGGRNWSITSTRM